MQNFRFDDPLDDLESLLRRESCLDDLFPFVCDHGEERVKMMAEVEICAHLNAEVGIGCVGG